MERQGGVGIHVWLWHAVYCFYCDIQYGAYKDSEKDILKCVGMQVVCMVLCKIRTHLPRRERVQNSYIKLWL